MAHLPTLTDAELRRAPSREALAVVAEAIKPGADTGRVRRLRGGIASGMHAVELIAPGGQRQWIVVRRYGKWRVERDPQVGEREWAALTALARAGAPTPRPLWLDSGGVVFGCPTIVLSRVPGRGDLAPRDLAGWIRQLAEALARIHAVPLAEDELSVLIDQRTELDRLLARETAPKELAEQPLGPEAWSALRAWWPRVRQSERFERCAMESPTIIHGDYWPGNTLWRYGKLTGVIDWEQVRCGDPIHDVACCRLDLTLLFGPEAADLFLQAYEAAAGRKSDRLFFWALVIASHALSEVEQWVEGYRDLGRTDLTGVLARARLERYAAEALAQAEHARED